MKTAKELRIIASEAQAEKEQSTLENSYKAVEHFTKDLHTYAERGKFFRKTTCLLHRGGSKFHCQTENDGEGFEIKDIHEVIGLIEKQGFEVYFKIKKGYCPLDISWE
jgi:hypothetical protein